MIFRFACPPAWYFFQIEIKISHTQKKITHTQKKSLLEAKIWFMLSFSKPQKKCRVFLHSPKVINKEYILIYGYSCSWLAVPLLRSKWKRFLDFIYIYKTFLGLLNTLRYIHYAYSGIKSCVKYNLSVHLYVFNILK